MIKFEAKIQEQKTGQKTLTIPKPIRDFYKKGEKVELLVQGKKVVINKK